jgi:hypothetical protein
MRPAAWILALVFACGVSAHAAGPVLSRSKLKDLTIESLNDGIPSGWCGRAMLSLLKKSGLGDGLKGGNGQDWEHILAGAGWKPVRVGSPHKAPLGSVLVYLGDRRVGKRPRGTRGGRFGHVEMVSVAPTGGRVYVADMPRVRPGGTVPDNFTGRAWVPPHTLLASAPPIAEQINSVLEERLKMARVYFSDRETRFAKLDVESPPREGLRRID